MIASHYRTFLNILLSTIILGLSIFIVHRFINPMLWAGVLAIATFPLYERFEACFGRYKSLSALLFTAILSLLILVPISWMFTILVGESQVFINYLVHLNKTGGAPPSWITNLPWFQHEVTLYWNENFGRPGQLKMFWGKWDVAMLSTGYYLQQVGASVAHRSVQLGFTLLTLFFFYRDGHRLILQINRVGEYCFSNRWYHFSRHLPQALRAIVNGTILIGLGVGTLLGLAYGLLDITAPALLGFITALAAMVPFVAPVILVVIVLGLIVKGTFLGALLLLAWGGCVMFLADHFIKPMFIGEAVRLPFLAVLFGILGGVETLGILGLFIGPLVMVLFITLWKEAQAL